ALGGEYRDGHPTTAKHILQSSCLRSIEAHRTIAVGVDMVYILGSDLRFFESRPDRPGQSGAFSARVERRPKASDLGVNVCSATAGMLLFLKDHHPGAFSEDDAISGTIKGPAGSLRRLITPAQLHEQTVTDHTQGIDLAVGAADQEQICLVAAQDSA